MPKIAQTLSALIDKSIFFGKGGTEISTGETLHMETSRFEKIFNCEGCTLAFSYKGGVAVTPFHGEKYPGLLKEYGYSFEPKLFVPLSDGKTFPVNEAKRWEELMAQSRATLTVSMGWF